MIKKCILAVIVAGSLPLYGAAELIVPPIPHNSPPGTPRVNPFEPFEKVVSLKEGDRQRRAVKEGQSTALHKAARRGNVPEVKEALEKVDVNQKNRKGKTALMCAVRYNKDEEAAQEIVQLLLAAKAKVCVQDQDGKTALDHASSERIKQVLLSHVKGEALFVEGDAKDQARQGVKNNTLSALHRDAAKGNAARVTLLLNQKADVNQRTDDGRTPLHYAADCKDDGSACAVAKLLLEAKAKPCAQDEDGKTAYDYGSRAVKSVIKEHLDKQREAARAATQLQEANEATQELQTPRSRLPRFKLWGVRSFSRSKSAPSSKKTTPSHSQATSPRPSLSRSLPSVTPPPPRKNELHPGLDFDDEKED